MSEERWQVTVRVPMRLPDEQREALFNRVADAVSEWEPEQRDGWDADVAAGSAGDEPLLPAVFGYEVGQRDARADLDLLLWLHAEASWWLALDRDEHESADQLNNWYRQAEYARRQMAIARADRDRERSSRQAWAEEALRLEQVLESIAAGFDERARERDAADDGQGETCDGNCSNDDCHTISAVATWGRAASAIRRALTEAARPQCGVHPGGDE